MSNDLAQMSWYGDAQFAALSDEGRETVNTRIEAVERILKSPHGQRGRIEMEVALSLDIAPSTVRGWVTRYKTSGGRWQSLIDRRAESHEGQRLPAAFLDFWKMLVEDNQRASRPAWKVLRRVYRSGATEYVSPKGWKMDLWPGYVCRPAASPSSKYGMPRGWSRANLCLPVNCSNAAELALARTGPIAASAELEMVLTTRRGLKPGQHYCPDDCWVDLEIAVSPTLSPFPVRVAELCCLDIASAKKIAYGLTPMLTNDEGKRTYIKKRDMRFLLAQILCSIGFHREGVTFWVEHGTAGIWPELEELIVNMAASFGWRITVKRGGIKGGKVVAGGYLTLGKGNPRFKAVTESHHNLAHNERGNLPGQTGKNSRTDLVEYLHGMKEEGRKLALAGLQYRPAVCEGLRAGFLTFGEYFWAHATVERVISTQYRDHELEGWQDNRFAAFRIDENAEWQPMTKLLAMPPEDQAAMRAYFKLKPYLTADLRMTREEVWRRGAAELVKLPMHCVPLILGPELAKPHPLDGDTFSFEDAECAEGKLHFSARLCTDAHGIPVRLAPRQTYRTWVNPFDLSPNGVPRWLFVATMEGAYLGVCPAKNVLNRNDGEEFHIKEAAVVAKRNAELLEPAVTRQRLKNRAITARRKRNLALMAPQEEVKPIAPPGYGTEEKPTDYSNLA